MMFTYRRARRARRALDGSEATQLCHAPAGGVTNESGLNGTYTSAFSNNDGIAHGWGRGATYWLKGRASTFTGGSLDHPAGGGRLRPHRHAGLQRRPRWHHLLGHRGHAVDRDLRRRRQRLRPDGRRA